MEIYTAYIKYCIIMIRHDSLNINSEMNAIMTGDLWITKFTEILFFRVYVYLCDNNFMSCRSKERT